MAERRHLMQTMRHGHNPGHQIKMSTSLTAGGVAKHPGLHSIEKEKRQINKCKHTDRRYYAKGMCVNCYHREGREKKAWVCLHTSRVHYSKGLCKQCYLANYYQKRAQIRQQKPSEDGDEVVGASEGLPMVQETKTGVTMGEDNKDSVVDHNKQ